MGLAEIVDTSRINLKDPMVEHDYNVDLNRFRRLSHNNVPKGTTSYQVTVNYSDTKPAMQIYRFVFSVMYGKIENNQFTPLSRPVAVHSDQLPLV